MVIGLFFVVFLMHNFQISCAALLIYHAAKKLSDFFLFELVFILCL